MKKAPCASKQLQERLDKVLVETLYNAKEGDCLHLVGFSTHPKFLTHAGCVFTVTVKSVYRYDKSPCDDLEDPLKRLCISGEFKGSNETIHTLFVYYEIIDGKIVVTTVDFRGEPSICDKNHLRCTACYVLPTKENVDLATRYMLDADSTCEEIQENTVKMLRMYYKNMDKEIS